MKSPPLLRSMMLLGSLASGCGDDLGPCDQEAATALVYGPRFVVATAGQALAHDSCGSGAFCHSSAAQGDARLGVPKSLDFDMFPSPDGWRTLVEHRDEAWASIESGSMPPRGEGTKVVGSFGWSFDPERDGDSRVLPSIYTAQGKEIVRNWLACDAPIVEKTYQPPPAGTGGDSGAGGAGAGGDEDGGAAGEPGDAGMDAEPMPEPPDWAPIFEEIITPSCAIAPCHDAVSFQAAGQLRLTDPCDARDALLGMGRCGKVRVEPGDPDASFLMELLTEEDPSCAQRMPVFGPLLDGEIMQIEAWIAAGANAESCD
jgi:hypothetical protein